MTTRQAMDQFLQQCEDAIQFADQQYNEGNKQEFYGELEYTKAMQRLEEMYDDLLRMYHSANAQQREQLHRARLRLQEIQNKMIIRNQNI